MAIVGAGAVAITATSAGVAVARNAPSQPHRTHVPAVGPRVPGSASGATAAPTSRAGNPRATGGQSGGGSYREHAAEQEGSADGQPASDRGADRSAEHLGPGAASDHASDRAADEAAGAASHGAADGASATDAVDLVAPAARALTLGHWRLRAVSRFIVSGSGPMRPGSDSADNVSISDASSSKSNTSKFSRIRSARTDFGMTTSPSWMCQRTRPGRVPLRVAGNVDDRRLVEQSLPRPSGLHDSVTMSCLSWNSRSSVCGSPDAARSG